MPLSDFSAYVELFTVNAPAAGRIRAKRTIRFRDLDAAHQLRVKATCGTWNSDILNPVAAYGVATPAMDIEVTVVSGQDPVVVSAIDESGLSTFGDFEVDTFDLPLSAAGNVKADTRGGLQIADSTTQGTVNTNVSAVKTKTDNLPDNTILALSEISGEITNVPTAVAAVIPAPYQVTVNP